MTTSAITETLEDKVEGMENFPSGAKDALVAVCNRACNSSNKTAYVEFASREGNKLTRCLREYGLRRASELLEYSISESESGFRVLAPQVEVA